MKVCLTYLVRNEATYLQRCLPIIEHLFDGILALDDGSEDGTRDVLEAYGATVRPWSLNRNYAAARNELIRWATELGYEWVYVLDGDECMFPSDIIKVLKILKKTDMDCVWLPRINFYINPHRYSSKQYPDFQCRAMRVSSGVHYVGAVHENIFDRDETQAMRMSDRIQYSPTTHVYHYGGCKDPAFTWLKWHNYGLIQKGDPTLSAVPDGFDPTTIKFDNDPYYGGDPIFDK